MKILLIALIPFILAVDLPQREFHLEKKIISQCIVFADSIREAEKKAKDGKCWEQTDKRYKIWSIPSYIDPYLNTDFCTDSKNGNLVPCGVLCIDENMEFTECSKEN